MMKQEIEQKLEEAGRSMVTSLIYKMICDKNLDQHHPQHHASDPLKVQDLEEGASPHEILMRIYKHHCVYGEGKNSILCQEK
jgi:hypothetical protein